MKLRRKHLIPIHRWTAMTLGLIALLSALTGAGLAFRDRLDPLVYPRVASASACALTRPVDAFVTEARRLHPAGTVDFVRVRDASAASAATVEVRWLNKDTLYFDRCTGALSADQNRYGGFFGILEWLHRGKWLPAPVGNWVMGAGACAMLFVLAGLGVYLWWPRGNRRFGQAIRLDRRLKGPAFTLGLHRTVGAWVAIPLALSALTGLPNAFESLNDRLMAIGDPNGGKAVKAPPHQTSGSIPLAQAYATVQRLMRSPSEVLIHVAPKPGAVIEIYAIEADAPHPNARSYLYLDSADGAVLRDAPYRDSGIGSRIYYWSLSWHTGEVGGVVGQMILFAGAAGALVLGYTGIASYLRRRFRQARPTVRTAPKLARN